MPLGLQKERQGQLKRSLDLWTSQQRPNPFLRGLLKRGGNEKGLTREATKRDPLRLQRSHQLLFHPSGPEGEGQSRPQIDMGGTKRYMCSQQVHVQ